jgi:hypothetical protein
MEIPTQNKNLKKRPDLLTVLCILTFIGSGLAAFSNFFIYLSYDEVQYILEDYGFDFPEFQLILSGGKKFFLAGFILYMISLMGAIRMWKLNKLGFHLYAAAQIFILIQPVVMLRDYPFNFIGMFITAAFIYGYYSQLKFMQ